jgi:DNA-binding GntR family transcriptional regulator
MAQTEMTSPAKAGRKTKSAAGSETKRSGQSDHGIHEKLYAAIIDHDIPPGTPLLEDGLAKAFGVSRTVIRKVLQKLSHERLVDLVPNKGASVAKPTAEEARQVFEARREIERILVQRAVANASDSDLKALVRIAKSEHQAYTREHKTERLKLSGDFHRQLAVLAGNGVLDGFLVELVSRTSLIIALYESPGAVPCSHTEHLEIANAMVARDGLKAAEYMEHHLRHIEAQIDLTTNVQPPDFKALFSGPAGRLKTAR